jgi:hypothetical protein
MQIRASFEANKQTLDGGTDIKKCHYFKHSDYNKTYLLTPWSRVLLERLTGLQLVKKFPAFYGTQRFISLRHSQVPPSVHILSQLDPFHTPHIPLAEDPS